MALVDLYVERRRLRAEIVMGRFTRVADALNTVRTGFLAATLPVGSLVPGDPSAEASALNSELVLRLEDLRLVCPMEEDPPDAAPPDGRRPRERVQVTLDLGVWQVAGDLYVADRVGWIDFMAAAKGHFLPLAQATVFSTEIATPATYEFLLVNADRVSALCEAT